MRNTHRPRPMQVPFINPEHAVKNKVEIERWIIKEEIIWKVVVKYIPENKYDPLYNPSAKLTWNNALKMPGFNVFKNMLWAALMWDAARAEAAEYQHHMQQQEQQQLQAQNEAAEKDKATALRTEQEQRPIENKENEAFVEESNENITDQEEEITKKLIEGARQINIIYTFYFDDIQKTLGIEKNEFEGNFDEWFEKNEDNFEYNEIRNVLRDQITASETFSLENIQMADFFVDRLAANIYGNHKTASDIKAADANSNSFGEALKKGFDNHVNALSNLSDQMVSTVSKGLTNLFTQRPSPKPLPTSHNADQFENELEKLGPPAPANDFPFRMAQCRLAMVKLMFPTVPKPNNALNKDFNDETKKHSLKEELNEDEENEPEEENSHNNLNEEFNDYAKKLGVDPRLLEKGADKALLKMWNPKGPELEALKKDMNDTSAFLEAPKKSLARKMAEQAMKPNPEAK